MIYFALVFSIVSTVSCHNRRETIYILENSYGFSDPLFIEISGNSVAKYKVIGGHTLIKSLPVKFSSEAALLYTELQDGFKAVPDKYFIKMSFELNYYQKSFTVFKSCNNRILAYDISYINDLPSSNIQLSSEDIHTIFRLIKSISLKNNQFSENEESDMSDKLYIMLMRLFLTYEDESIIYNLFRSPLALYINMAYKRGDYMPDIYLNRNYINWPSIVMDYNNSNFSWLYLCDSTEIRLSNLAVQRFFEELIMKPDSDFYRRAFKLMYFYGDYRKRQKIIDELKLYQKLKVENDYFSDYIHKVCYLEGDNNLCLQLQRN